MTRKRCFLLMERTNVFYRKSILQELKAVQGTLPT